MALYARARKWLWDYFSSPIEDSRSPTQLERETYILWHPRTGKFQRWMIILPTILCQMCIGSLYTWSIFNRYMDSHIWGTPGDNARAFMFCIAFYGFFASVLGPWIARHGPFAAVRRTLVLTPAGWAFAALGSYWGSLVVVYVGFGVCHGLGIAHTYLSTTSMLQQQFPETKGFAAGLGVMGFGLGSYVWTLVGKSLLDPAGPYAMLPYQVQAIFGVVFFVIIGICLPLMRVPAPGWTPPPAEPLPAATTLKGKTYACAVRVAAAIFKSKKASSVQSPNFAFLEATKTLEFALLAVVIFGISMPGICFLSSAADMVQNTFGYDAGYAGLITSVLNLTNFTGRFFWGLITDHMGRKNFFVLSTSAQTFAVGLMALWIQERWFGMWLVSFLLIGSLYGGSFGVLPAFVSDMFGPKISVATHGVMISVWALASMIGINVFAAVTAEDVIIVAGVKYPSPDAYVVNTLWLLWPPAISFIAVLFLNVRPQDRALSKAARQLWVRVGPWVLACSCFWISPQKQQELWVQHTAKAEAVEGKISQHQLDLGPPQANGSLDLVLDNRESTDGAATPHSANSECATEIAISKAGKVHSTTDVGYLKIADATDG